mmetsp:Transcript_52310/g.122694  ORF Transcript_52310/g.122694 Transcript_52310/m.122694 type:complete len:177 (-) Transcript_52310:319-849(-)
MLSAQAAEADIKFRFDQKTNWHPIESQRTLLWASRLGKAEEYIDRLNYRHFELGESASARSTVLAACKDVGLDADTVEQFLNTDELTDAVWKSYGDTIRKHNIHSIPFFVFSVPELNLVGGPFRGGGPERGHRGGQSRAEGEPWIVNGSMSSDYFLRLFNDIAAHIKKQQASSASA